jgi:signal transduction histidine kinase
MSHEIRTPLNAIVGFSECIKAENNINEAQKDADDIIMASQNLLEIVNGILDISKIEANKMEIVNTNYELLPNLDNLAKLMIPRIGEKPIELIPNFAPDIPAVMLAI